MSNRREDSSRRAATVALATTAAIEVARGAGIELDEKPVLLPGVANAVLGFPGARVVAKVATRKEPMSQLPKEHSVAVELERLGAPTARPLDGVGPTVHTSSGFVVTLWHWIDHDPSAVPEPHACARALAALHEALDATTTPLPSFLVELGQARTALDDNHFMASLPPPQRTFLRRAYDAALEELDRFHYTPHRLHGEPHEANRLVTPDGVIWVDLESTCTGPREWDLAFLASSETPSPSTPVDHDLLACLRRLEHARLATWRWGLVETHPDLRPLAARDLTYLEQPD